MGSNVVLPHAVKARFGVDLGGRDPLVAEVVMLDCMGPDRQEFEVELASQKPETKLPFEHRFHPEGTVPAPMF